MIAAAPVRRMIVQGDVTIVSMRSAPEIGAQQYINLRYVAEPRLKLIGRFQRRDFTFVQW
jgi:hypothetical protein